MQGRSKDPEADDGRVDPAGEGEGGMSREGSTDTCASTYAQQTASRDLLESTRRSACSSVIAWRGGRGGSGEAEDGGDICIQRAD